MPPRWLSAAIILFWLATTGWLVYQNVSPLLTPDHAPPYTIDLEDEVQTHQAHVRWSVLYNDHPCLRAETWTEFNPSDDTFSMISELHALIRTKEAEGPLPFSGLVEIQNPTSSSQNPTSSRYRVTRAGDLRAVALRMRVLLVGGATAEGTLKGEVHNGLFRAHLAASCPDIPLVHIDQDLDPVAVPVHGSILSPMHPVNRITGLRPGWSWRLPLVDPVPMVLSAMAKKFVGDAAPDMQELAVTAHVRPRTEPMIYRKAPVDCYVIDYQDQAGEFSAHTWVRVEDGAVLRQDAERNGERWTLQRE